MTLYEYQPVVSAYYDGACYCQKQLITACDPWSGYYLLDSGFYTSLHFSRFIEKGWAFIDSACYSDGKPGGDGHAIVDAVYSYMTAADPETGDYSTIITNTTAETMDYTLPFPHWIRLPPMLACGKQEALTVPKAANMMKTISKDSRYNSRGKGRSIHIYSFRKARFNRDRFHSFSRENRVC